MQKRLPNQLVAQGCQNRTQLSHHHDVLLSQLVVTMMCCCHKSKARSSTVLSRPMFLSCSTPCLALVFSTHVIGSIYYLHIQSIASWQAELTQLLESLTASSASMWIVRFR